MNLVRRDWNLAQIKDTRLADLAAEACRISIQTAHSADDKAYQSVKQYLEVLLGVQRGAQPRPRQMLAASDEATFAGIAGRPYTGSPNDEPFLRKQVVLDRSCQAIYDEICAA